MTSQLHLNVRSRTLRLLSITEDKSGSHDNGSASHDDESASHGNKIASPFESIFSNLNFGYERSPNTYSDPKVAKESRNNSLKLRQTGSQSALCYPEGGRLRGCQTLYADSPRSDLENLQLQSLPCVKDGTCPYSQFKCSKGHVWKGVIGSPVCFHCPVCETSRKVYGRKKEATADRLLKSLKLYAATKGSTLLSTTLDENNKWSSLVSMRCDEGHNWTGKVGNILINRSGCIHCAIAKKRVGEDEMHRTASHFGGFFLGFVHVHDKNDDESVADTGTETTTVSLRVRRALWQCAEGHTFNEIAGNIRRPPHGKRKCSWCKICRRKGQEFEWNPTENGLNKSVTSSV